jgi:mannose-6-phosphate isomerase class I
MDNTENRIPHLLTTIDKAITIKGNLSDVIVKCGETCLVPANYGNYDIDIGDAAEATVLRTTF